MPRVGDIVTLKRLKQYASQGWNVLINVIGNHFHPLESVNPVWLRNGKNYSIISIDFKTKTLYAILLDEP
jgi:hypothetical protein